MKPHLERLLSELPKAYDPAESEPALYQDWVDAGLFHAEADDPGEPFSIVFPPPNVTGSLHIGHALVFSVEDAMIRRARMQGMNAVFVPGMDHAGIATQNVVEKQLATEGLTRHDLGREKFVERVWEWKEQSGGLILKQLRRLGTSADWEREAFTFDEPRSRAVREVFVALHEQGLIYRGNRLINWCPRCHTALSDIEVDHSEVKGELFSFTYRFTDGPLQDGTAGITVATTRAETMLADTAIAVHPTDERYASAIGRTVTHPFSGRTIPVIADEYVDPEFGSGAVKITPAHDPNDYEIGKRHDLEMPIMMTFEATVVDDEIYGAQFAGMDRLEARTAVKAALAELGLAVGAKDHDHQVGHCSRCKTSIEPMLSDQWFVSVRPLADRAIEAMNAGDTVMIPERLKKSFMSWLENLHDWCISRQIWWGHRIPAFYCEDGHASVAREDLTSCPECSKPVTQDDDVLDTWFSSQLWPFTVFGWEKPGDTNPDLQKWYPTTVLETGYDINTFWVSRMLMSGLWFLDEVPFKTIYNHGMVRDQYGKKMSKSFGNVIDPLEFIDEFGADALRFALFQHCSPGTDVPLAPEWVEGAKRFTNKLWNATRFALGTLEGTTPGELPAPADLTLEDRWILSRLEAAREQVEAAYETWDWARISSALYHFAWDELADWYLEAAKTRLYGDDEAAKAVARPVLARVLDDLLRLLQPLIPFVTETLWRSLTGAEGGKDSLMVAAWPGPAGVRDEAADADFAIVQDMVTQVRRFRAQNDVAPAKRFPITVASSRADMLAEHAATLCSLAGLDAVTFVNALPGADGTSTIVFSSGEAEVSLTGLIDVAAERARLVREIAKASEDLAKKQAKLGNEGFVAKAPEAVVAKERAKAEELISTIATLEEQHVALAALEDLQ
ncbi:MAG: valyl-tRNA synthetase [Glaciecola sp.]